MRSTSTALLIFLLPVLLLSGCLEVKQELWIESDGSGRIRFDISAASPEDTSVQASSVPAEEFIQIARQLRRDPRLKSSPRVEQYVLGGDDHVALEIALHRWNDLPAINRQILDMGTAGHEVRTALSRVFDFSLVEDKEGNILYRQIFSREDMRASRESLSNDQSFLDASRAGGALRIILHSPTISRTNGSWQLNKTSVRWSINLKELAGGRRAVKAFETEIGASARSPYFWRVIGIVLVISMLVGILTLFRHVRRRARKTNEKVR